MIFLKQARRNAVKLIGEKTSSIELARGRLVVMGAVFTLAYIFLAARAVDLMVIQAEPAQTVDVAQAMEETHELAISETPRADIIDRNGELLATTLKTVSLYADPHLISNAENAAERLAKIFPELEYGETLRKFQKGGRFAHLKYNLTPDEQHKVLEIGEPGLAFKYEDRRVYPQGALTSHLVGYAGVDNQGLAGIEKSFNGMLSEGKPVSLTLDVRLQHALRREMQKAIDDFSAEGGAGVIMDVATGEVLAGVSLPDFDPNLVKNDKGDEMFNRVTLGTYELGSVFKIFSTAAFLETHDVPMSASFDASEPLRVGKFVINDYHAEDRVLTIPEVFMHSSNIGAAMMGQAVGTERLKSFYADLGLTIPMEIEVPEIGKPQVPRPWGEVHTVTASYGHGLATTPLQMTSAVSSIVNGGYLVSPHLVLNKKAEENAKDESLRIVSPQTVHRMRQLLRLTVTEGTGSHADVPGYRVGGKTGTAEKSAVRGYDRSRLLSSFVGVFPVEAPRYAIYIVIDEPHPNKKSFGYATGGWVGAPAVARVISSMVSILAIPPADPEKTADLSASLKQYVTVKKP
jgi:cell division protein FtsI (penicillin-binding protein 3)